MQSYASQRTTARGLVREARNLYENYAHHVPDTVRRVLLEFRDLEKLLLENYDFQLSDRDVLDIGVGQFLPQMHYLAQRNRVTGIDFDVIAQGINPVPYLKMFFLNGPRRTAKTIARKLLGVDRRYRAELKTMMQAPSLQRLKVLRMDACNLTFPDSCFDFVHSFSVFHSLPDPEAAARGVVRVLRPGGVAYVSLHLYTSESGFLDPRAFTDERSEVASWPHLRPQLAGHLQPNAWTNKLRLADWRKLFDKHMPASRIILTPTNRSGIEDDAKTLFAGGELLGYTLEELVTHRLQILWQKS